jgi:hypothetical protein
MVDLIGREYYEVEITSGVVLTITEKATPPNFPPVYRERGERERNKGERRTLKIECGNMLLVENMECVDIVMMETDLPPEIHEETCELLSRLRDGAMILTYHDMRKIWATTVSSYFCFQQLEVNRCLTDRYPTSWSVQRGHHFYLWKKVIFSFFFSSSLFRANSLASHLHKFTFSMERIIFPLYLTLLPQFSPHFPLHISPKTIMKIVPKPLLSPSLKKFKEGSEKGRKPM